MVKSIKLLISGIALSGFTALLAACGATGPVEESSNPPDTSQQATTNYPSLVGNYTVKVVAKDISQLLRFEEPSVHKYRGDWLVSLDDQGNFTASLDDQVMLQGLFVVGQGQITFTSEGVAPFCGNDPEETSGTYSWYPVGTYKDYPVEEGIGLIPISDKCYVRSLALSSHTLKLIKPVQNPPRAG